MLIKGRDAAKARKNAADLAAVVRADQVHFDVLLVLAHQDCDAVEPAHEAVADAIEHAMRAAGIEALAVVPAFEMETWWFLWPDAATAVNAGWKRPAKTGQRVGLIENAKEELRRCLRPASRERRPRDYEESDGPRIASQVRLLGLVDRLDAVSDSFLRFRDGVRGRL